MLVMTGRRYLIVCVLLGLASAAMLAYAIPYGPTVYSDGVVYLLSADNLVKGNGFGIVWGSGRFHPLAGYPPLYPLLVALVEALGLEMLPAARVVAILAFGLTVFSVAYLGQAATRSAALGLSAAAFVAACPLLMGQYANAGSEGVFYLTGISGLAVVLLADKRGRRASWLVAALLLGLAFLTRYVGIALILTGCVWVLLLGGEPLRRRVLNSALLGAVSLGLMLPWLAWTHLSTGTVGERSVHSVENLWSYTEPLRSGLIDIAWRWLPVVGEMEASYRVRGSLLLGLLLLAFAAIVGSHTLARRGRLASERVCALAKWSGLFLLFGILYVAVHAAAFVTTHPTPDVSERLLTPLYTSAVFVVLGLLWMIPELRPGSRLGPVIPALLVAGLLVLSGQEAVPLLSRLQREGGGFNSPYWRDSETVERVRELPEGTPIISHAADALIFLTGRPTYWIPELMRPEPDPAFPRFGDHPERSEEEHAFRYRHAALVVFPWIEQDFQRLYDEAAQERVHALLAGLDAYWIAGPREGIFFYPDGG